MSDVSKYITFKRADFDDVLGQSILAIMIREKEIQDAVVIRRQDRFASPCLLTYATMIAMVAENHQDVEVARELYVIADYFHTQGVLAGEEGYKLPTL